MQATCSTPRDLAVLFGRLADMERLAATQEWWLYGRVLPEARRIAEMMSLLAAARAELGQLLETLGYPQATRLSHPGTSELRFAQSFAGDDGWALAHREEALSVLHLAALAVPVLLSHAARIGYYLTDGSASQRVQRVLGRLAERLSEVRTLAAGY
ncbi:MAG: hypothetical protein ACRDHP_02405 [Ktedonobacterales bacterium]